MLAFAVVVLGVITSIETQRRGYDLGGDLGRPSPGTFAPADVYIRFGKASLPILSRRLDR